MSAEAIAVVITIAMGIIGIAFYMGRSDNADKVTKTDIDGLKEDLKKLRDDYDLLKGNLYGKIQAVKDDHNGLQLQLVKLELGIENISKEIGLILEFTKRNNQ